MEPVGEVSIWPIFVILSQVIEYMLHHGLCTRRFFFVLVYIFSGTLLQFQIRVGKLEYIITMFNITENFSLVV